ncbi:hypothetical protein COV15_01275 [Candidatus Woesearchaeota archaeon CG10_big_fil_rev_8_21_14_0_10_34_12]|nr:MAG: hypothetical protein COV15_01275 [Candidatus Woesearchaeota archaeon CG10_big_fil_rev_8_21_14_0_10_34_12]
MAKLTAWLVTIIGLLLVLEQVGLPALMFLTKWNSWVIPVGVLIIGIGKLMRNYKSCPQVLSTPVKTSKRR